MLRELCLDRSLLQSWNMFNCSCHCRHSIDIVLLISTLGALTLMVLVLFVRRISVNYFNIKYILKSNRYLHPAPDDE